MVKNIVVVFVIFLLSFFSACQQDFDFGNEINRAIREGKAELVVPAGRYVINETIVLDGIRDLTIRTYGSGDVVITSDMLLSLDDFTCLDAETGLYEITRPEFKSDPWPDSFRGYAGWPEIYINYQPLRLARWP
ncbi:MAG: hypothetical protein J7L96_07455, partial [Bacteroidales bacterium]|nr:hypothetical protein [Bacteroidales bacterium]